MPLQSLLLLAAALALVLIQWHLLSNGWGGWSRTTNLRGNNPVRCQLRYTPSFVTLAVGIAHAPANTTLLSWRRCEEFKLLASPLGS